MSTWIHAWGPPSVVVIQEEGRTPLHTARQTCLRCGAERNPISLVIAWWGRGTECKDNPDTKQEDWSSQLDYVREQLGHLKGDGRSVDVMHTGREARAG